MHKPSKTIERMDVTHKESDFVREKLRIAFTEEALELFGTIPGREPVNVKDSDFTDVAAVVMTDHDEGILEHPKVKAFGIPVFLIVTNPHGADRSVMGKAFSVMDLSSLSQDFYKRQIESAAAKYEAQILPPFFKHSSVWSAI